MADGSLEALQWLGLALMNLDHVNKFYYDERLPSVFPACRVVIPIFGFVLAYNLARPNARERGVHQRMITRLLIAGVIASPIVIALNATVQPHHPWWPLNILFTLFSVVVVIDLIERGGVLRYVLASLVFVVVGAFVEYFWMGMSVCVTSWLVCREATLSRLLLWGLAILSLNSVNANPCALLSIPLVLLASSVRFPIPRSKWLFYAAYPMHLAVLLTVRHLHIQL